jgi:hypothetical protein
MQRILFLLNQPITFSLPQAPLPRIFDSLLTEQRYVYKALLVLPAWLIQKQKVGYVHWNVLHGTEQDDW